jgi:hypothetical protein
MAGPAGKFRLTTKKARRARAFMPGVRGPSTEGGFLLPSIGQTPIPDEPDSSGGSLTCEFGLAVAGISSRRKSQSEFTLAFPGETLGRSGSRSERTPRGVSNVREAWSSGPSRLAWASERIVRKPVQTACEALDVVPFGGEPGRAAGETGNSFREAGAEAPAFRRGSFTLSHIPAG